MLRKPIWTLLLIFALAAFFIAPIVLISSGWEPGIPESMVPSDIMAFARRSIDQTVARDTDGLIASRNPAIDADKVRAGLEAIYTIVPHEAPRSTKIIGMGYRSPADGPKGYILTLDCDFPGGGVVFLLLIGEENGRRVLTNFRAQSARDLSAETRFGLAGKGPLMLLFLLGVILVPAFTIATTVVCVRTPGLRRKWLWITFVVLGLGQVNLNWTSGMADFTPFAFHLLGAGFVKMYYQPVVLSLSLPVGAIIFWARRRELQQR